MQYLKTYLKKIKDRGNTKLAESIEKTAEDVGNKHIKTFAFSSHEIGLLLGNVQSGKTGQMFGIMCKAADMGFPAFVLLTTDNVVLQQQTLDRVKADFEGFCICGENDAALFTENSLMDPVIIVLKKNARMLKLWANILNSTGFMKGNPLFIIDDEADAASLNTLVNRNRQSSINKYLDNIKNGASSSLYLQVTGTPQAIFLQTLASGWHPYFTYYFQPGDAYLGGDFFFPASGKPECISYLENLKTPMREVVIRHLLVSAQILMSGGKVSNCLFHPSVRVAVHKKIEEDIYKELKWCVENLEGDLKNELSRHYDNVNPSKTEKCSLNVLYDKVKEILSDKSYKVFVMNGKNEVESSDYETGCNFVVGGNTLGRGVTFPGLQTIYYTRTSKKPQADTMWQHSRMFGYDRDPGMMKVYIDENLYKLFADINATNNSIIAQVEKGIQESVGRGPLAAYPVVGVKAVLYDGSYHPVDSSEMAFKTAAIQAFKKGVMEAGPVLLEPIMSLKVTVPDAYTGDIMGDLNKRRGRVLGMTPMSGGKQIIEADIPMSGLFGYCTDLRSMTGGRGDYSYEFARYEQAPSDVQEKEVAARAAKVAENNAED